LSATELAPDKASLSHQFIWITADEFAAVAMRANAEALKATLQASTATTTGLFPFAAAAPGGTCQYQPPLYRGFLPVSCKYPDPVLGPLSFTLNATLQADKWHELAFYAVAPSCAFDAPGCVSNATLIPSKGLVKGALLARSRKLSGQDCGAQALTCLEGTNKLAFDPTQSGWPSQPLIEPDLALPSNDILKELK
jgi:hypothetical protein